MCFIYLIYQWQLLCIAFHIPINVFCTHISIILMVLQHLSLYAYFFCLRLGCGRRMDRQYIAHNASYIFATAVVVVDCRSNRCNHLSYQTSGKFTKSYGDYKHLNEVTLAIKVQFFYKTSLQYTEQNDKTNLYIVHAFNLSSSIYPLFLPICYSFTFQTPVFNRVCVCVYFLTFIHRYKFLPFIINIRRRSTNLENSEQLLMRKID